METTTTQEDFPPLSLAEMLALDIISDVIERCGGDKSKITYQEIVDLVQPYIGKSSGEQPMTLLPAKLIEIQDRHDVSAPFHLSPEPSSRAADLALMSRMADSYNRCREDRGKLLAHIRSAKAAEPRPAMPTRAEIIEQCAKVADQYADECARIKYWNNRDGARYIAGNIRALLQPDAGEKTGGER